MGCTLSIQKVKVSLLQVVEWSSQNLLKMRTFVQRNDIQLYPKNRLPL